MKNRIFMYLFLFSVLLIIFQYVNSKNIIDKYENDIKVFKGKILENEQLVENLQNENFELGQFSIVGNEEALTYFEDRGYDTEKLIPTIMLILCHLNTNTMNKLILLKYRKQKLTIKT